MKREPKTIRKTRVTKVTEPTHVVCLDGGKYYSNLTPDAVGRAKATGLSEDEAEGQAEFLRRLGYPKAHVEPLKREALKAAESAKTPIPEVSPERSAIRRRTTSRPPANRGTATELPSTTGAPPTLVTTESPVVAESAASRTTLSEPEKKFVVKLPSGGYFSSKVEFAAVSLAQADRLRIATAERITKQLREMGWQATVEPAP